MLEILALIYLCRVNGANAVARGKKGWKYILLTAILWIGLEICGAAAGLYFWTMISPETSPLIGSYILGIIGAISGGIISYRHSKYGPVINNTSQNNQKVQNSYEWNSAPGSYTFNEKSMYGGEMLNVPATIRIIEELGGNGAEQTYYYMNGQPVCALYPGMEAVLKTRYVKNIVSIAKPQWDKGDNIHCVRFIAAEDGMIEIHSSSGELIPELFKNYSSN